MGRKATALLFAASALFTFGIAAATLAQQQRNGSADQQDVAKPLPYVVRVRLPNYFGQVGLSREQRRELRKICEKFDRQIAELRWKIRQMQQEIRKLREEKEAACLEKLTDEQRQRLEQLKAAAARRRAARRSQAGDDM